MRKKYDYYIVLVGQFPPPVNGLTYITQELAKSLSVGHRTTIIDIAPHIPKKCRTYHLRRILLTLKGLWPLLSGSSTRRRLFYVACEGGLGLVYTAILCAAARILGYPIFIHHHSFAYIENSRILMACLLSVLGKCATHIFLCRAMAQRFADRYQSTVKSIILSNSAFVDEVHSPLRIGKEGQTLVIGLLSNLNDEKGLGNFLDVLRSAKIKNININGVLAGPAVSENDRDKIAAAKQDLGERLDYLGPVYGEAKTVFFRSIDVFVFPTRYVNEAQPTVIFEAMAHGVPVLSYDRGCIKGQVGKCGAVITNDYDFISFALDWLMTQMTSPETFEKLKLDAKIAFLNDRTQAKQRGEMLFDLEPFMIRPSLY